MGPSILDLTDSNPLSRLQNSEFRSLQGLKMSLRNEIDKNLPPNVGHPKVNHRLSIEAIFTVLREPNEYCKSGNAITYPEIFQKIIKRRIIRRRRKIKNKTELTGL